MFAFVNPPQFAVTLLYSPSCVVFVCCMSVFVLFMSSYNFFFSLPLINSGRPREKRHSHPVSVSNSEQLPEQALQDVHPAGQVGEGAEALRLPP